MEGTVRLGGWEETV